MRFSSFSRRARGRVRSVVFALCVSVALVVLVLAPGQKRFSVSSAAVGAPVLLTQSSSTRAIALDSVTRLAEPFQLQNSVSFGSDARTRVMLFATNLTLGVGENASAVTADAEDFTYAHYPMTVEYVGAVPGQAWMTAIVVRLDDNLGGNFGNIGDVLVGITYQGMTSNRVRIGIGHIGGGPPDDPPASPTPTPGATPELGAGASLHGKQLFPSDNPWNRCLGNAGRSKLRQPDRQYRFEYRTASGFWNGLQRRAKRHSLRGGKWRANARAY